MWLTRSPGSNVQALRCHFTDTYAFAHRDRDLTIHLVQAVGDELRVRCSLHPLPRSGRGGMATDGNRSRRPPGRGLRQTGGVRLRPGRKPHSIRLAHSVARIASVDHARQRRILRRNHRSLNCLLGSIMVTSQSRKTGSHQRRDVGFEPTEAFKVSSMPMLTPRPHIGYGQPASLTPK